MTERKENKKVWQISIQESGRDIAPPLEIPITHITDNKVMELLRTLVAKYTLNDHQIANGLLMEHIKQYDPLLKIQKTTNHKSKTTSYSCGVNPYVVARVREK